MMKVNGHDDDDDGSGDSEDDHSIDENGRGDDNSCGNVMMMLMKMIQNITTV